MAGVTAGKRDRKVVFERATTVQDDHGEEVPSWAPIVGAFAAVSWGAGSERREAAQEQGTQAATFRVLATAKTRSVSLKDRLMMGGEAWDITSIAPVTRGEIEFTATRAVQ